MQDFLQLLHFQSGSLYANDKAILYWSWLLKFSFNSASLPPELNTEAKSSTFTQMYRYSPLVIHDNYLNSRLLFLVVSKFSFISSASSSLPPEMNAEAKSSISHFPHDELGRFFFANFCFSNLPTLRRQL